MREFSAGFKLRDALETCGLVRAVYHGVKADDDFVTEWARRLSIDAGDLAEGISALVDSFRRTRMFYDPFAPIHRRRWHPSDPEVTYGFLPSYEFPPRGIKLQREEGDNPYHVTPLLSPRGMSLAQNWTSKWRLEPAAYNSFLAALWEQMIDGWRILTPVKLYSVRGGREEEIQGTAGVHQVDSTQMGLLAQFERYRCQSCQRVHSRPTPFSACTSMRCRGMLRNDPPPPDDYNITLLTGDFSMIQVREHSAQVPPQVREGIETEFKKPDGLLNCLVATPTLELGVDIGDLDLVLMRNVPPRPTNYWQRSGRAGRRHRMAVIYTYCGQNVHDGYFFHEPQRLLNADIDVPKFNLRNYVMLHKHVRAAALTELNRLASSASPLPEDQRRELAGVLRRAFPTYIRDYLFEAGRAYRAAPYDVSALEGAIQRLRDPLLQAVEGVFTAHWPSDAEAEVTPPALALVIDTLTRELQDVVNRLYRRLMWTVNMERRLNDIASQRLLDQSEQRLHRRCSQYIQHLNSEGAITYTLSVLATQGFLPSYGIHEGSVVGFARRPSRVGAGELGFELSRPPTLALGEFVPGNMIYANGERFRVAYYHFPAGTRQLQPEQYVLDPANLRVSEPAARTDSYGCPTRFGFGALPVCDCDLAFLSRISDEEQFRFRLPGVVVGYLLREHRGGEAHTVGEHSALHHLRGQRVRLFNLGPSDRVRRRELGYPICTVCGAVRSPYATKLEEEKFHEVHLKQCGKPPEWLALSADVEVDGLLFQDLPSVERAVNLGEGLRLGAEQVLEMSREDLSILTVPRSEGGCDLFLYDPMPGGSGLLKQLLDGWHVVIDAANHALQHCPRACATGCYDCLWTYYNAHYRGLLRRAVALEVLAQYAEPPRFDHNIPAAPAGRPDPGSTTNPGEERLRRMLERAGFSGFQGQVTIPIGRPFQSTTPDFAYTSEEAGCRVAVYLDGLSKGIHGSIDRQRVDQAIRAQLQALGFRVVEISRSDLDDPEAMVLHMKHIAHALQQTQRARLLDEDRSWFEG